LTYGHATDSLLIGTAGSTRATIDSSGNLGLGVTPSAWGTTSGQKAFQIGTSGFALSSSGAGSGDGSLNWNGYYNGTNWIYSYSGGGSSRYRQNENGHAWFTAPSGTAGNAISFTQAMTLDASGNLGLGTTSPNSLLSLQSSSAVDIDFNTTATGSGSLIGRNLYKWQGTDVAQIRVTAGTDTANHDDAFISFFTSDGTFAERARITSDGNFLVGTTSGTAKLNVTYVYPTSGASWASDATSSHYAIIFNNPNGLVGSITTSGSSTAFNTSSDQRLKENIQDADSASSLIDSLQVRKFDWKSDNLHQRYGFVAQELVTVAPEAVHQPVDTDEMMAVDYSKLVPMLVKEIQSLRQRLSAANL